MADKILNTRIRHKRDTSANWTTNNPVLLNGELIIVDTDAGETRFKIGDGTKTYTQLPFQDELLRNSLSGVPYSLQKEGSTIKLVGSDGSVTSVEDEGLSEEYQEKLDSLTVAVAMNIYLLANEWSDNRYVLSNENIEVDSLITLTPRVGITSEEFEALQVANIVGGEQSQGSIVLVAMGDAPSIDIPITLIIGGGEGETSLDMTSFITNSDLENAFADINTMINSSINNAINTALAGDY